MKRRTGARIIASLFVVTLVLGVLAVGTGGGTEQATSDPVPLPTPAPLVVDEARCDAAVDAMTARLGAGFAAAADPESANGSIVIQDSEWQQFFTTIATSCPDSGDAVSDLVVYSGERAADAEPSAALLPILTVGQLCGIDSIEFTPQADETCASTSELLELDLGVETTVPA